MSSFSLSSLSISLASLSCPLSILRTTSQAAETIYDINGRAGAPHSYQRAYVISEAAIAALDFSATVFGFMGLDHFLYLEIRMLELGLRIVQINLSSTFNAALGGNDSRAKIQKVANFICIIRCVAIIGASLILSYAPPPLFYPSLVLIDLALRGVMWLKY